jgi:hypothetical protein
MNIEMSKWTSAHDWVVEKGELKNREKAQLVMVFGRPQVISDVATFEVIKKRFPNADIVGCSTAGNVLSSTVSDDCMVVTAMEFEKSKVKIAKKEVQTSEDSFKIGQELMKELDSEHLRHVFILSDGLNVNGSELARGVNSLELKDVQMTGGLAGDGTDFKTTWVLANGPAKNNQVVAVGFYGENLKINIGCVHGWEIFGVNRNITRSDKNVLYEIDNEPALPLFKRYLGEEYSKDLPSSGLRFPLCVYLDGKTLPVVRTLLAIDEATQSLTYAGDVPEGKVVLLMKSNKDRLIEAAKSAAKIAKINTEKSCLALVVSCVGRRLVLSKLVEAEVEEVQENLGHNFFLSGFYSYGELAPLSETIHCYLHNQTMTLTTITES